MRRPFLAAAYASILLGWSAGDRAQAQFAVCNQTLDALNLAVGQLVDGQEQSEGWWTIGANRCVDVIKDRLVNRYIYIYATDVFGQPILSLGNDGASPSIEPTGEGGQPVAPEDPAEATSVDMCIGPKRFLIRGIQSCWQRGHKAARFMTVDTKQTERWTLFLKEPDSG